MKLSITLGVLLLAAICAFAADIGGKWTAQVPAGGGTRDVTFTFKVDGEKLTGTMAGGPGGDASIEDGKVSGDSVSFAITTQRGKRTFTGAVSGNEIKFKREGGQGGAQEFTAKRAAS